MQTRFRGRVWTFGDDISTDHIIAGKYLGTTDPNVFAEHAFEAIDPTWAKKVQAGDIIVAGANFGCGSSRAKRLSSTSRAGKSAFRREGSCDSPHSRRTSSKSSKQADSSQSSRRNWLRSRRRPSRSD